MRLLISGSWVLAPRWATFFFVDISFWWANIEGLEGSEERALVLIQGITGKRGRLNAATRDRTGDL